MKVLFFNSYRMLSQNSSKPDVRMSFIKYLKNCKHRFDAICLAESSSSNIGVNELLPEYNIYQSALIDTRLYQQGFKFSIASRGECLVKPINYPTDDYPNQAFINSDENIGYCSEQLFSIRLGSTDVVVVHIQAIDSRIEMKELSKYSQSAGLKQLCVYMKNNKPDVVIGDFNLGKNTLRNKLGDLNFDASKSIYSFANIGQDVYGGKIHHALRSNSKPNVEYISEVHTHLTTALLIEINS